MPCKTYQAALRGERSKPHYFLGSVRDRRFQVATSDDSHTDSAERALQAFEARINWSTWGRSR